MKSYLPYSDFLDIGENLNYGQKIRINHNTLDCQGESNSMLVEKKDDGSIMARCFRCGRSGRYSPKFALKSKNTGSSNAQSERSNHNPREYPGSAEYSFEEWSSVRARQWVRKYGITKEEVEDYGIVYNPVDRRVYLPIWSGSGSLAGYQSRKIYEDDPKPKYISYISSPTTSLCGVLGDVVVITEDLLSAIKVGRQYPALPLFGTCVRDIHTNLLITKGITKFVLWLDDDNQTVRRETLKNQKLLNKIGQCVVIHTNGKDPKEHTDTEIKDIISNIDFK